MFSQDPACIHAKRGLNTNIFSFIHLRLVSKMIRMRTEVTCSRQQLKFFIHSLTFWEI